MSEGKGRLVVVLTQAERDRLEYEADGGDLLLDRRVQFLILDREDPNELRPVLSDLGLLQGPGMLVESPFEKGRFERVEDAATEFAHQKLFLFSEFCGLLGAKEVKVLRVIEDMTEGSRQFEAGGKEATGLGMKAKAARQQFERFAGRFFLHDHYPGGAPQPDEAEALLRRHRLLRDMNMVGLLRSRRSSNQIASREVQLSALAESSSDLQIAASLKVPAYISIDSSFRSELKQKQDLRLEIRVVF